MLFLSHAAVRKFPVKTQGGYFTFFLSYGRRVEGITAVVCAYLKFLHEESTASSGAADPNGEAARTTSNGCSVFFFRSES